MLQLYIFSLYSNKSKFKKVFLFFCFFFLETSSNRWFKLKIKVHCLYPVGSYKGHFFTNLITFKVLLNVHILKV